MTLSCSLPKTNKENDTFLFQATLIDCAHPLDRVGGVTLTLVGLTLAISFDFFGRPTLQVHRHTDLSLGKKDKTKKKSEKHHKKPLANF